MNNAFQWQNWYMLLLCNLENTKKHKKEKKLFLISVLRDIAQMLLHVYIYVFIYT